ncbi:hypothetical protein EDD18DRAFT_1462238 [Armillaria luteobubalina]|uniref:Transmembrane protein n=1 Tax=Armillaria luteobubalina TaxID=153913 RepID=A0AA39Q7X1_9AGAR|nr:hypothetical protein EDD18DRAFT_1462238 [Armillaria luteobubalina]
MLFVITACIAVYVVWLSASEPLATTTGISWRWLDVPFADVGLLEANTTSTEMSDTLFQAMVVPASPNALHQVMDVTTVLKADSSQDEPDDMMAHADDTPPQGIIWQLPEPTGAVVEVTVAATTSVDDAVTLVSVHPQLTQFPVSVARVRSRLWSSSLSGSITPVSLFTIAITILVGFAMGFFAHRVSFSTGWDNLSTLFVEVLEADSGGQIRQGKVVVVEDIPVTEKTEHGENPKATDNTASIPSGNVSSSDAVQPLRTSISEVQSTDDKFTPGESRASLYATAAEGNTPSQTTDGSDVFSVPTVSSEHNIYMLAATMLFPSLDDLAKLCENECEVK